MKKLLVVVLTLTLAIGFVGCGEKKGDNPKENDKPTIEKQEDQSKDKTEDQSKDKDNDKENDKENETAQKDNKEEEKEVNLYLFNSEKLEDEVIKEKIKVEDKAMVKALTEALKKDRGNKYLKLPKEAEVTSAEIKDEILTISFSKNFIKDMPLGTATESGLISSIVNTYGNGTGVKKVKLKLAGEVYTGLGEAAKDGAFEVTKK